jgi:hypothetical protein
MANQCRQQYPIESHILLTAAIVWLCLSRPNLTPVTPLKQQRRKRYSNFLTFSYAKCFRTLARNRESRARAPSLPTSTKCLHDARSVQKSGKILGESCIRYHLQGQKSSLSKRLMLGLLSLLLSWDGQSLRFMTLSNASPFTRQQATYLVLGDL